MRYNEISGYVFLIYCATKVREEQSNDDFGRIISAHKSLYTRFKENIPINMENEISSFRIGNKKIAAKKIQDKRTQIGKGHLPVELYDEICTKMLTNSDPKFVFARTVMVLCWNLICRISNCVGICFPHINWNADALTITFPRTKTDQEGKLGDYERHVYANPLRPGMCPILAMAIFIACYGKDPNDPHLFPGGNQKERFSKELLAFFKTLALNDKSKDYGTHSIRKGASTYAIGGTTDGPSSITVRLRAGWSVGDVMDRYLFAEKASDQYVGRIVACLPAGNPDFAILPPHFFGLDSPDCNVNVDMYVNRAFTNFPDDKKNLGMFLLASLVYHYKWIKSTLPADHIIFNNPIFNDEDMATLEPYVHCHIPNASCFMKATGIPSTVGIMQTIISHANCLHEMKRELIEETKASAQQIMEKIVRSDVTPVTRFELDSKFAEMAETMKRTLEEHFRAQQTVHPVEQSNGMFPDDLELIPLPDIQNYEDGMMLQNDNYTAYVWNGMFHRLPATFKFPETLEQAWTFYCCGNGNIPPLRFTESKDYPRKLRKVQNDYKFLMEKIRNLIPKSKFKTNMSVEEARSVLKEVRHHITSSHQKPQRAVSAVRER